MVSVTVPSVTDGAPIVAAGLMVKSPAARSSPVAPVKVTATVVFAAAAGFSGVAVPAVNATRLSVAGGSGSSSLHAVNATLIATIRVTIPK
ncbi:hypothetical protein PilKf_01427 [Pillotina sp. SPG140]